MFVATVSGFAVMPPCAVVDTCVSFILVTASGSSPKPETYFLPGS